VEEIMKYPEAINLPFNSNVIRESYVPAKPGQQETAEPGFWVIVREDLMVFRNWDGELSLFEGDLPEPMKNCGEKVFIGKWKSRPLRLLRIDGDNDLPPGFASEFLLLIFLRERIDDELLTVTGHAQHR
jgi:NAD+ diphosphatase